jgi:CRP/FNR family cyclic AMP-dependent transcriptional regulator
MSTLDAQDLELLAEVPLFNGLTAAELTRLLAFAPVRSYRTRTVLMEKGDEANALYVVLDGRVRIFSEGDEGKEITLNELGRGQYFGELALISDTTRCASAITLTATRLLALSKAEFTAFLARDPGAALRMIQQLADKVRDLTRDVERLALRDVYGRLIDALVERARTINGRRITDPITQQELAHLIGASREMVSRIFKELRSGGYISLEGKRIVLLRDLPQRW